MGEERSLPATGGGYDGGALGRRPPAAPRFPRVGAGGAGPPLSALMKASVSRAATEPVHKGHHTRSCPSLSPTNPRLRGQGLFHQDSGCFSSFPPPRSSHGKGSSRSTGTPFLASPGAEMSPKRAPLSAALPCCNFREKRGSSP